MIDKKTLDTIESLRTVVNQHSRYLKQVENKLNDIQVYLKRLDIQVNQKEQPAEMPEFFKDIFK